MKKYIYSLIASIIFTILIPTGFNIYNRITYSFEKRKVYELRQDGCIFVKYGMTPVEVRNIMGRPKGVSSERNKLAAPFNSTYFITLYWYVMTDKDAGRPWDTIYIFWNGKLDRIEDGYWEKEHQAKELAEQLERARK